MAQYMKQTKIVLPVIFWNYGRIVRCCLGNIYIVILRASVISSTSLHGQLEPETKLTIGLAI